MKEQIKQKKRKKTEKKEKKGEERYSLLQPTHPWKQPLHSLFHWVYTNSSGSPCLACPEGIKKDERTNKAKKEKKNRKKSKEKREKTYC